MSKQKDQKEKEFVRMKLSDIDPDLAFREFADAKGGTPLELCLFLIRDGMRKMELSKGTWQFPFRLAFVALYLAALPFFFSVDILVRLIFYGGFGLLSKLDDEGMEVPREDYEAMRKK